MFSRNSHTLYDGMSKIEPSKAREIEEEQPKEPFGVVEWKKMLTHPPYTKKAVDFKRKDPLDEAVPGS